MESQVVTKVKEFLNVVGEDHYPLMKMNHAHVITFIDEDKFLALDPVNSQVFLDKEGMYAVPFDFEGDPEIRSIVDKTGRVLLERAKVAVMESWLTNF